MSAVGKALINVMDKFTTHASQWKSRVQVKNRPQLAHPTCKAELQSFQIPWTPSRRKFLSLESMWEELRQWAQSIRR